MTGTQTVTTLLYYPRRDPRRRLFALCYFTVLITLWTIAGHTVLGFEQSWAHPLVSVAVACAAQIMLELVDARAQKRHPRFVGGVKALVNFLPPAWIAGLAVAMLIYPNERLTPMVFAAMLSVGSKVIFRAPVGNGSTQHIFNPSNFGITATLLLFPWVGLAPPYHFTENVSGLWDWVIPGFVLLTGIGIHALFTGRLPLVLSWIAGFVLQGLVRNQLFGSPLLASLAPMTSAAFILFTLYMIPDPATTPLNRFGQLIFGFAVAAVYGLLLVLHVVFSLFLALFIVAACRGIGLHAMALVRARQAIIRKPIPTEAS